MKKLMLITGLLLMTVCACAGQTTEFFLDGFNYGSPSDWQNGYPYYARIGNPTNPEDYVMCDSYAFGGAPGQMWIVFENNLSNPVTTELRFYNHNGMGLIPYLQVGWLLWDTQTSGPQYWTVMNQAVWNLFDSNAPCTGSAGNMSTCQYWLIQAQNPQNYQHYPTSEVEIFTPSADAGAQEFLCVWNGSSCLEVPSRSAP